MLRRFSPILALLLVPAAWAQRPPVVVPSDSASVIERLPPGYADLMPGVGIAGKATPPIAQIQKLLAVAARTGDARLAARADAMLEMLPKSSDAPDVLRARAFSAQHRHDFQESLRLLGRLINREPRDGDARLARAQVNLVQGRLDQARSECTALVLGVDEARGLLCIASLSLRAGKFPAARTMTDRWLAQASPEDPSRRYVLVMRAETAWRGGEPDVDHWYRDAIALSPDDARTLASYSRYLRATGRDSEVEALLAGSVDSDGLQLQRTLAAHALGSPEASALIEAQGRRYAVAHEAGSQPEMRDEAEYLLTLRNDPEAALALSLRNFESQRDYEDVDILRRSALAAHQPKALEPLQAWAKSQQLSLPGADR